MNDPTASVIVPTYNERDNIEPLVNRVLDAFSDAPSELEVLIVDDDSPDGTGEHATSLYRNNPHVRVITRTENPGLSQAVVDGFGHASGRYCAVIDADLQHPPECLPTLFAELAAGADIAIGSRHVDKGGIENWSATRKLVSRGATGIAKLCVPSARSIADPMSGFFAVRSSVLTDVRLEPQGYKILLEILSKCDIDKTVEVPYIFRERQHGESKLEAGEYQNFLEHALGLAFYSYGGKATTTSNQMVRAVEFAGVGGIGIIVNMVVFWLLASVFGAHYLLAGAGAFFAAVNWNFVGNWAVTFNRPETAIVEKLLKFYTVSIIGYFGYTVVLEALIGQFGLPILLGNIGAIIGASAINFLGTDSYVFEADKSSGNIGVADTTYSTSAGDTDGGND